VGVDLVQEPLREAPRAQVGVAGLRGDGESGRHGEVQVGHLGEVGPLAAQEVLHLLVALAEVVDVLGLRGHGTSFG
jgi:hypothetical protein